MSDQSNTAIEDLPENVIDGLDAGIQSRCSQFEDRVWWIMKNEFGDLRLRETVASLEYLKHDIIKCSYGEQ